MKLINKNFLLTILILSFTSCTKDFLDIKPKAAVITDGYYKNESEAFGALISVYDAIRKNTGGFENMVAMMNAGSDDNVAGGGAGSYDQIHIFDDFTLTADNVPGSYWSDHFQGVFRANILISKLPGIPMDEALKSRFNAEAKALRALYYFNLVRLFGNVPLFTEPLSPNAIYEVTQSPKDAVYKQIEQDLVEAKEVLPSTVPIAESGRLTKGAVQALLGKVYLFEGKNSAAATEFEMVNGTPGGTSIYGYKLLTNYNDLWVFSNKFNTESILECSHSNKSKNDWGFWGSGKDEGNTLNVMCGIRGYSRKNAASSAPAAMPSGWSYSTFTKNFYDFIKTDPRFGATVLDLASYEVAGDITYLHGDKDLGYYMNKFMPRPSDISTLGGAQELNYQQDSYIIRLADTYLMEAEALGATGARAQALLDAVRARVGLPSIPVSLNAIKNERRAELAGEGHRFFDLVRWGDAKTVLKNDGFVENKNEVFPIPARELRGTKLVQNQGY